VSMWEPFSRRARRTIVRAQEVAHLFGSDHIGTEHLAFVLAEADDEVGHLLALALDRDAIRERLGAATGAPQREMVFAPEVKRVIELAFVNARRLNHDYIGVAHLALGLLDPGEPPAPEEPPRLAPGTDIATLRTALVGIAGTDNPNASHTEPKQ
jgi:ATP-dependent Clp protease ATP-binding subunit ClpC